METHFREVGFSSGHLMTIAQRARDQIAADSEDAHSICDDAWIAVVFSAAAVEALLNELPETALWTKDEWGKWELLAKVLRDLEESRTSVVVKIQIAHLILTGRPPDRGALVHQDFELLVRLRNEIMHVKPVIRPMMFRGDEIVYPEQGLPKLHRALESRGLLRSGDSTLPNAAGTRATAQWACRVACETVKALKDAFPQDWLTIPMHMAFAFFVPLDPDFLERAGATRLYP